MRGKLGYIYTKYAIRRVQGNQDGLKLNGTHQLLAYADDVNIPGRNVHTVKENAEALVVATKDIGLEVNVDKTKYMIMSRDQNAGRSHSMKTDNSCIERVSHADSCYRLQILFHPELSKVAFLVTHIKIPIRTVI